MKFYGQAELALSGDKMSVGSPLVCVGKVPFGKGVFATQDIPAGTDLGEVQGKVIDDPDYSSPYCIDLGSRYSLEPRAPYRYLNHCCSPNCQLMTHETVCEDGTPGPREVRVEALIDISGDVELTIDYQWSATGAIRCLCGSQACRGWIVAEEELAAFLQSNTRQRRSRTLAK